MAKTNQRYDRASSDAQTALTEFITEFRMALAQDETRAWASEFGKMRVTSALLTKYPVPLSSAGFKEQLNDPKYRSLLHQTVSVKAKTWQDGVAEQSAQIESDDFFGWDDEPARMAAAARSLPNEIVAGLLANGKTNTDTYDGVAFFGNARKANPVDTKKVSATIDNLETSYGLTIANIAALKTKFRSFKAANGKPLGLRLTHVLVPAALEETARDALQVDLVSDNVSSNAVQIRNRHANTVQIIVGDELTEDAVWYGLAMNKMGLAPWGLNMKGAAPEIYRFDKGSEFWRQTNKVAVDARHEAGGNLLMPHTIIRCEV